MEKIRQRVQSSLQKIHGKNNWVKQHRKAAAGIVVLVVLLLSSVIGINLYYSDKAAPATTIANIKVGGQTKSQITKTIDNLKSNLRLSLTYGGKSATASSSDLGVNIDTEQIANKAVQTGSQHLLTSLFGSKHFDLTGSYNKDKVKAFVNANFPELSTAPKDAQIIYDKTQNRYVVQPGAVGKSVNLDKLYAQVEKLLASPKLASYEIATNDDQPAISDAAAKLAADKANKTLAQNIQITNNGRVLWTIDPWTIAEWTKFTAKEPTLSNDGKLRDKTSASYGITATTDGGYSISYDKDKVTGFVNDAVANQLPNKPINQTAITNGNNEILQIVSQGRNGQAASNTKEVASQIYDKLVAGDSGQIELKTKDTNYGTNATVAKDGHWVEANLSTYTVTLWDGKNPVWSTNQTSQGKPDTPTITGLYQVWSKVYNQCMPNPPSTEPLCNIHYVTYWERSGYAFHEAWWLGSGNVRSRISHGCINMYQADAKRVYDWSSIGTPVWVHY